MDFKECENCFGASMNDCMICPVYLKWLQSWLLEHRSTNHE